MTPSHLSCDKSGKHFAIADAIGLYTATMDESHGKPRAAFVQLGCPALLGEGLQDVAMSCDASASAEASTCKVLALHRHGRRIASCPVDSKANQLRNVESISDRWLENARRCATAGQSRSRAEKAMSLSIIPECEGDAQLCAVLGTSHGRVVQLGQHSSKKELIPTEMLHHEKGPAPPAKKSTVRSLSGHHLGVLHAEEGRISILDLKKGGLAIDSMVLPSSMPVASFCAGGGSLFVLTSGHEPELWKLQVPKGLL